MSIGRAIGELTRAVQQADQAQQRMGLSPISEDTARSWVEWQHELDCRVNRIASQIRAEGRPSYGMVASLGAQVVALLMAVDRAEEADPVSGDGMTLPDQDTRIVVDGPTEEQIERRALLIFDRRGGYVTDVNPDLDDYKEAERQLREEADRGTHRTSP